MWPDGTGKLRSTADAWRAAARTLQSGQDIAADGIVTINSQTSPEVDAASSIGGMLQMQLAEIADQCNAVGKACDDFAQHIDDAHTKLINEVVQFLAITGIIQVAGAIAGAASFGAGEVVAQVGEGFEVAAVIARVVSIINDLNAAAVAIVARISTATLDGVSNVPPFFPTIDIWDKATGFAASIKSINLWNATYQDAGKLEALLKRYVDKMADYSGSARPDMSILERQIKIRGLVVAIPPGETVEQATVFAKMETYANSVGVKLTVRVIE